MLDELRQAYYAVQFPVRKIQESRNSLNEKQAALDYCKEGKIIKNEIYCIWEELYTPWFKKNLKNLSSENGEYLLLMWVYSAERIFNPLFVADKHMTPMNALINNSQGFRFPDFSSQLLEGMKNELPIYL